MDKLAYIAMTGAKQIAQAQAINSHNLANANTTGFRADLHDFQATPINGPGYASRVNAVVNSAGWSSAHGALRTTGNPLDVAVSGGGWIAVQAADGSEAYTKAGDLRVNALGQLVTGTQLPVMGDTGPVAVPPHSNLTVGADGTISIVPLGQGAATSASVDRMKLVNPPANQLVKGDDGLIRLRDGSAASADASVSLTVGALEGSNVNVVGSMVSMIELARQFEIQVRMIDTANDNSKAAASIMRLG